MATASRPAIARPTAADRRIRFTVEDYHRMAEAGILHEDSRVELIDGDLIAMSPIGPHHAGVVDELAQLLIPQVIGRAIVRVQNPVRLDDHSEPEPDLVLAVPRDGGYRNAHPGPDDVLLLIEVMASSADRDRDIKLGLYAKANIAEVWLVDLNADRVEIYRSPAGGTYTEILDPEPGAVGRPGRPAGPGAGSRQDPRLI